MRFRRVLVIAALTTLVGAAAAAAHVEVTPPKVPAGVEVKLVFHVPAERKVPSVKLDVKLPAGLTGVRLQSKPGWTSAVRGGVATWSGGKIRPGKSERFGLKAVPASIGPRKMLVEHRGAGSVAVETGPFL